MELINYIKRKFFTKNNFITLVILNILICLLLLAVYFVKYLNLYYYSIVNSIDARTLIIEDDIDYNDILHKDIIAYSKLNKVIGSTYNVNISDNIQGSIILKSYLEKKDIVLGRDILKDNEIICSSSFYPFELYTYDNNKLVKKINHNIIDDKKIIGKKVSLLDSKENNLFEIIGLYNNNDLSTINTCYVNDNAYEKIALKNEVCSDEECEEYNPDIVIVNDYSNVDDVSEYLSEKGINVYKYYEFDKNILDMIVSIPKWISMISIIIIMFILFFVIKRNIIKNKHDIFIKRAIGCTKKQILLIYSFETLINVICSFIIAFIIYSILIYIINNYILVENYYYGISTMLKFNSYICIFFFTLFITIVFNYLCLRRIYKDKIFM